MKPASRIILTGANGVVGSGLLRRLLAESSPELEICLLLRSESSRAELRAILPSREDLRVRIVEVDLRDADAVGAVARYLTPVGRTLLVHCAADVSWGKSAEELTPLNVWGTLNLARLLDGASHPHFLYLSSAYTSPADWRYRNGYEQTKAQAERELRSAFPHLPISTFSCSLVVGDQFTGEIARFHGLYPLVRLIAASDPPFVIGRADCLIDIVPADWVADELAHSVRRAMAGEVHDVVAAAGPGRMRLDRLFDVIQDEVNAARASFGAPVGAKLPLLSHRRWAFLQRSIDAWRPPSVSLRSMRQIEYLIEIYHPYTMSDEVRAPSGVTTPCPPVEAYLDRVVRYWLKLNRPMLEARWRRSSASSGARARSPGVVAAG